MTCKSIKTLREFCVIRLSTVGRCDARCATSALTALFLNNKLQLGDLTSSLVFREEQASVGKCPLLSRSEVRHKSSGQTIWTAQRPEQREGEGQGRPESIRQGETEIAEALLRPVERRAMDGEAGAQAKQDCEAQRPFWTTKRPAGCGTWTCNRPGSTRPSSLSKNPKSYCMKLTSQTVGIERMTSVDLGGQFTPASSRSGISSRQAKDDPECTWAAARSRPYQVTS